MNSRLCGLLLCALLTACAAPPKPTPQVVELKLPELSAQESNIEPPPLGIYSTRLTTFLEKLRDWRSKARRQLSSTPQK